MNNVSLVGNLTRDPAFFQKDDKFIAKFDIATEVGYDAEEKKQTYSGEAQINIPENLQPTKAE